MRLNRSRSAGQAVAHDQEIDLAVPRLDLLNRGHPVRRGEAARAQRQRQHQSQKQTEPFLHLLVFLSFVARRFVMSLTNHCSFFHGFAAIVPQFFVDMDIIYPQAV